MDPRGSISVSSVLRYWGCTIQAGTQISAAFGYTEDPSEMHQEVAEEFLLLSFSFLPFLLIDSSADWDRLLNSLSQDTKELLRNTGNQYRGGSELLIEAGDQRRIIKGKVGGAKFVDRNLIVSIRS